MKKGVKLLIAIMAIAIIGMAGFIIYDKVIKNDEGECIKKENNVVVVENTMNPGTNTAGDDKYTEIKKELDEGSSLFVTGVVDEDGAYTIRGVIYDEYIVSKDELKEAVTSGKMTINGDTYTIKKEDDDDIEMYELCIGEDAHYAIRKHEDGKYHLICLAQISTCQRMTDKYGYIIVEKTIECEDLYTEELKTVEEEFSNFKAKDITDTTHPVPSYTFEFKNGKCIKVWRDSGI